MTVTFAIALWLIVAVGVSAWIAVTPAAPPLPKRLPPTAPDLAETADDMAVTSPQVLADIFRRENAHLPR